MNYIMFMDCHFLKIAHFIHKMIIVIMKNYLKISLNIYSGGKKGKEKYALINKLILTVKNKIVENYTFEIFYIS